jgi:hypothetical protein
MRYTELLVAILCQQIDASVMDNFMKSLRRYNPPTAPKKSNSIIFRNHNNLPNLKTGNQLKPVQPIVQNLQVGLGGGSHVTSTPSFPLQDAS